ncbi:HutD family protein [Rhodanobacter sp. OR87]|uniref:HutD/Ves family protein n=1 Tax=Rhodanobacter sp. OR87 TaxID=1076523 RepID=UPI0003F60EB6|nr:HutD family protein [Rhodanobacter sp. OR87]
MILRLADCPPQPWKNGLGRTREIAIEPAGAGMDDFLWRVSVAEVDSAAPFSAFPGIDRQIVLLDGAGFTMTLDDGRTHALTTPCAPFAFPGEARVEVALAGGPTRDFNLMLRRGRVRGGIEVWREAGPYPTDAATVLVYCARGTIDGADGTLQAGDAWQRCSPAVLTLRPGALALAVRVEDVA